MLLEKLCWSLKDPQKGKQKDLENITSRINWDVVREILVMILLHFEKLSRTSRDLLENVDIY